MDDFATELHRLLLGDYPWWFLLEVLLRSWLIYIVLFITMRLMGKRMAAQLSISELAVMITLGAAVGVPLQTAEQGVFPAAVLLLCALCFQRVLSVLSFRHRSVEVRVQGDATVLLQDGRLLMDSLRASRITAQRIFSELRAQNVQHLGELRRVYLESTGDISILRYTHPHPGLPLIRTTRPAVSDSGARSLACSSCGYVACSSTETPPAHCEFCKCTEWIMIADPDQPGRTKV